LDPALLRVASIAGAAWMSGLACVLVSFFHLGTIRRRRSPGVEALCERVDAAGGVGFMTAELRELAADAERGFALAALLPRALGRVALTSGTALGVLVLAAGGAAPALSVAGAIAAFAGGLAGMLGSVLFGQQAKALAITARAEWRAHLREVERRLTPERSTPG
jgi:hypothetical protein